LAALLGLSSGRIEAQEAKKPLILKIGSSGSSALNTGGVNEKDAIATLEDFIKTETRLENKIIQQKTWMELGDKMAHGELQLGDFQGFEFAWARMKYPELTPVALAVNGAKYIHVYVIAKKGGPVAKFADLQGQAASIPKVGEATLRLFVDRLCQENGKPAHAFFSKINSPDNVEDSLDDVHDGIVQAAVVNEVSLNAYKRLKPGRFVKLQPLAKSEPLPGPLIAYYKGKLDLATLEQVEKGLLNANKTERGQKMLQLFKITGLEKAPDDFEKVLELTLKKYPPPGNGAASSSAAR
jgi:ABC-type phosphate/phosphonate transport system substrate-binding protein